MRRPEQHETDSAGQRLLREVFEGLGWTVNVIENDYGADFEVEIFDHGVSTGATFKVQLKSSRSTAYSVDETRISQPIRVANARYLAHGLRSPAIIVHCDVVKRRVFWTAPQLQPDFGTRLDRLSDDQLVAVHLPVENELPASLPAFLDELKRVDAALSVRSTKRLSTPLLVDVVRDTETNPGELIREYQSKSDALRLDQAYQHMSDGKTEDALRYIEGVLSAKDSAIADKYRAWLIWEPTELNRLIKLEASDRLRTEATKHVAQQLRQITQDGPPYLRFHAAVFNLAAEIDELARRGHALMMAKLMIGSRNTVSLAIFDFAEQQLNRTLDSTLIRAARVVNRLLRSKHSWALPTALTRLALAVSVAALRFESEGQAAEAERLREFGFSICTTAASIARLIGDQVGLTSCCSAAVLFSRVNGDPPHAWATQLSAEIKSPNDVAFVRRAISNRERMNRGERVEGKIKTTARQIMENVLEGFEVTERLRSSSEPDKQSNGS